MNRKTNLTSLIALLLLILGCSIVKNRPPSSQLNNVPTKDQVGATVLPEKIAPIKAPFTMPQLQKPIFQAYSTSIIDFGAKEGVKVTKEIQQAIDQTSSRGGGKVIIPKGNWNTGRISLKSNVNLHLEEGATLYFSGEIADYLPAVFTRFEGVELMSLGACIYADNQQNIAVTGKGRLIGPPKDSEVRKRVMESDVIENVVLATTPVMDRAYEGKNGGPIFLPMFISPINCKNVLIEGISLENTAVWNVVPVYCENVIIRGITVNSVGIPRGDGIDIESSRNVLIEYCTLSTGDDCFTIKAGRGDDGLRVNKPTENIVIRYCLAKKGHGGITCGSETAGMIRNVSVQDCVFDDTRIGIRFKTRRTRAGGGENLYYERIRLSNLTTVFDWDMLGTPFYMGKLAEHVPLPINRLTPRYNHIVARNIIAENVDQFVKISGIPESPVRNVLIEHIDIKSKRLFSAADVNGFVVKNAKIETMDSKVTLLDTKNIIFINVNFIVPEGKIQLKVTGRSLEPIKFKNCSPIDLQIIKTD